MDVDNVKPTGLVIGAALIMLALGKPLTGSRAFGGASFALPQMGDCKAMVSLSLTIVSAEAVCLSEIAREVQYSTCLCCGGLLVRSW